MPFNMPPKREDKPPFPTFKQAMDAMFDRLEKQTGAKLTAKHRAEIRKGSRPQYNALKARYENAEGQ